MIHLAKPTSTLAMAGLIAFGATLGGCAGAKENYPSFAIPKSSGEAGRISMRFPAFAVKDPADPGKGAEPLPEELDARLAAINARALKADEAFSADAPMTDRLTQAAALADESSEEWAEAQVSLASLTAHHGVGRLALAELDLIAANARIALAEPETIADIAALQDEIAARLDQQAQTLGAMSAKLER